jgi:hypothetical protein
MGVLLRSAFAFGVALISALAVELVAETVAAAGEEAKVPVTFRNFVRAETDFYFSKQPLGKLSHSRTMADIDEQPVVRMNRDTLYSSTLMQVRLR